MKAKDPHITGRPRDPAVDSAILKAGLKLFLEQGIEGVNYEQISRVTGISRATIYRRWKSRRQLLRATLESARTSDVHDPAELLNVPPGEIPRFLEETIVLGLMSPIVPKLVTQLIGASNSHPELLATWCRQTLEPGWRVLHEAIAKMQLEGAMPNMPDPQLLRDMLAGAILHRLLVRTQQPREHAERAWVKRLMYQTGLIGKVK